MGINFIYTYIENSFSRVHVYVELYIYKCNPVTFTKINGKPFGLTAILTCSFRSRQNNGKKRERAYTIPSTTEFTNVYSTYTYKCIYVLYIKVTTRKALLARLNTQLDLHYRRENEFPHNATNVLPILKAQFGDVGDGKRPQRNNKLSTFPSLGYG